MTTSTTSASAKIQQLEEDISDALVQRIAEGFTIDPECFWSDRSNNKTCCAIGAVLQQNGDSIVLFAELKQITEDEANEISAGFIYGGLYNTNESLDFSAFKNLGIRLAKKHVRIS